MIKKQKRKYDNFNDFIQNDDKIVMPFLLTLGNWMGAILFTLLFLVFLQTDLLILKIIFGVMAILGIIRLVKFYKLGGTKNLKGLKAKEVVWGKTDGNEKN